MQLPGRLRHTTLGDVFGALHRERATGVLELIEVGGPSAGGCHRVRFDAGLIANVETPAVHPRLGELLVAQGCLSPEQARHLEQPHGGPSGSSLVAHGRVRPEWVAEALHRQIRQRLEPLFQLEDALLRFRAPRPSARDELSPAPLSAPEFLHGRPRARRASGAPRERGGAGAELHDAPASRRPARSRRAPAEGPWRVLGLQPGASRADVQRAFRRLAAQAHPDRFPQASAVEKSRLLARFAALTVAYHALIA